MNTWIDAYLSPAMWSIGTWSLRFAVLAAFVGVWLALKPPRLPATRLLACQCTLAMGLLMPLLPGWWGWHVAAPQLAPQLAPTASAAPAIESPPSPQRETADAALPAQTGRMVTAHPDVAGSGAATPRGAAPSPRAPLGAERTLVLALTIAWLVGVTACLTRLALGWAYLGRLKRGSQPVDDASRQLFESCRRELGVRRAVSLGTHADVRSPVFVGGRRARVLLPMQAGFEGDELRAVLLHELSHASRYDDWAKLAEECLRAVLFFHPAVHALLARIESEREALCDASSLAQGVRPRDLAAALLQSMALCRGRGRLSPSGSLAFVRRRSLKQRIAQLLDGHDVALWRQPSRRAIAAVAGTCLSLTLGLGSFAILAEEPAPAGVKLKIEGTPNAVLLAQGEPDEATDEPKEVVSLRGRLVDAAGQPLVNAAIEAGHRNSTPVMLRIEGADLANDARRGQASDATGSFTLASSPEGPFRVGDVATLHVVPEGGGWYEVNVVVGRDETTVHVPTLVDSKLALPKDVGREEIAGIVTDAAGKPLEGVTVDAWDWSPGSETRTKSDGTYRLKVGDERTPEVRFSKPGFSPVLFVRLPAGKATRVVLDSETYVEGSVTSPDGKPVPNALVRFNQGPKFADGVRIGDVWTHTRTDGTGKYRLYLHPDAYVASVRVENVGVAKVPGLAIAHGDKLALDLPLSAGVTFRAKVVDSESGDPVQGVRLWNWQHKDVEGHSDADGNVNITGMDANKFKFQVKADGYTRWWSDDAVNEWQKKSLSNPELNWQRNFDDLEFDIRPDMEPVTIVVEEAVRITGRVVSPDGQPVGGATVAPALTGSGNSLTGDTRFSVTSNKDGSFEMLLPASNDAKYNLVAHDGKYQQWRNWANGVLPPIQTKPGDELKDVTIELTKGATVTGIVLDSDGKPMANWAVRAHAADKLENRYYDPTVKTKEDGTFVLPFVRPGDQYIQADPFYLTAEQGPPGATRRMTLEPGQVVEGIELTGERRP